MSLSGQLGSLWLSLDEVDGELKFLDSPTVGALGEAQRARNSKLLRSFTTKKLNILAVRYEFMTCSEAP
jgi:hypothetical protein